MKREMDQKSIGGYLATPDHANGCGVIVLHAWWGLNAFCRGLCDRLADEGLVALAPDLYHGRTASTVTRAEQLSSGLRSSVVSRELSEAVTYLQSRSAILARRIGVIGFSMGGYYAFGLARQRPDDIAAVVIFYGTRTLDYRKTKAAFLGHFAENDRWAPPEKVRKLEEKIRAAGKKVNFYTYPRTKHWFFEEDRPDAYDANASRIAWDRTVKFLKNKL